MVNIQWKDRYRFTSEAEIKAILFDFGDVIWNLDHKPLLQALSAACGKPVDELQALVSGHASLFEDYESGRVDSPRFLAEVSALCGHDFPEPEFIRAFTGIFTPNGATQDLIRRLKPHYKLGLISNTNPWHYEYAIRRSEVFPLFDSVTLSFQVGAMKPDPRLFEDALDKLDLMAEECIFVDDQPAFAQAATDHLLHGIAFTTPVALMAELRRLKVAF